MSASAAAATTPADPLTGVVADVRDPEIDVNLGDLGVVRSVSRTDGRIVVHLAPTRLSCPARGEIARRVRSALTDAAPGHGIKIVWERGAWQPTAVTSAGHNALHAAGYRVAGDTPRCPYCAGDDVVRAAASAARSARCPTTAGAADRPSM